MPHIVYLGLGSNLGERKANLEKVITFLSEELEILVASSVYETPPWGYTDQPAFFNQVIKSGTCLQPRALLEFIKQTETQMGRKPTFRYGPRCIDVDILFYDDLILESEELDIPHPQITERAFVLVPLAEIAPDLVHPIYNQKISALLERVDRHGISKIMEAA